MSHSNRLSSASPVPDRSSKTVTLSQDDKRPKKSLSKDIKPSAVGASSAPSHAGETMHALHRPHVAAVRVAKLPAKREAFVHVLSAPEQGATDDASVLVVEVQDGVMSLIRDSLVEWSVTLLFDDLRIVAGNRNYIVCGGPCTPWQADVADDEGETTTEAAPVGQVLFLSTESGRALCPPIFLDSPVCHLAVSEGRGAFACALSLYGGLYLWNLACLKNLTPMPTANGLLHVLCVESHSHAQSRVPTKRSLPKSARGSASVLVARTSLGGKRGNVPLIELSHGAKYIYHLDMNAWMKLETFPLSDFLCTEPAQKKDRLDQIKERMTEGSSMLPRRQASLCHIEASFVSLHAALLCVLFWRLMLSMRLFHFVALDMDSTNFHWPVCSSRRKIIFNGFVYILNEPAMKRLFVN